LLNQIFNFAKPKRHWQRRTKKKKKKTQGTGDAGDDANSFDSFIDLDENKELLNFGIVFRDYPKEKNPEDPDGLEVSPIFSLKAKEAYLPPTRKE
jgi:hypothetical protein